MRVVLVFPSGNRVPSHISVGQPVTLNDQDPADNYESYCAVEIQGLQPLTRISGGGSLQALLLGLSFLGMRLHDFGARGGRVVHSDEDSDVELKSIFGTFLRGPDASE
jgi:hypothetical protein